MTFHQTPLAGAYLIDLDLREDERGLNARLWCQREFRSRGLSPRIVQSNLIVNRHKGTLRGLHYQVAPAAETKMFRVVRGAIFDVIVDLREESPTFRKWYGVELSAAARQMLYVPRQFAQGFITLTDDTEITYQVSAFYTPALARGIRFDDPSLGIDWPLAPSIMSATDAAWPALPVAGVLQER